MSPRPGCPGQLPRRTPNKSLPPLLPMPGTSRAACSGSCPALPMVLSPKCSTIILLGSSLPLPHTCENPAAQHSIAACPRGKGVMPPAGRVGTANKPRMFSVHCPVAVSSTCSPANKYASPCTQAGNGPYFPGFHPENRKPLPPDLEMVNILIVTCKIVASAISHLRTNILLL